MKHSICSNSFAFFACCLLVALLCLLPSGGARGAELPYGFHVEWAALTPAEGQRLAPPVELDASVPLAVLWLTPQDGYHTYAHKPGEGAMPTEIGLSGAQGRPEVRYLPGTPQADVFDPAVTVNVYDGPTPVFLIFSEGLVPAGENISVSMLACSARNCFPVTASIPLESAPAVLEDAGNFPWFSVLTHSQPGRLSAVPGSGNAGGFGRTDVSGPGGTMPTTSVFHTPDGETLQALPSPFDQDVASLPDISLSAAPEREVDAGGGWLFSPQPFQASLEVQGLGKAVLFGLLAGLILNIMPCVLPVLTLKISALLAAEGKPEERRRAFREHNLLFSAGVLTWFGALALLFGMAGMAWGQLFQNSAVVLAMLVLIFCLGLSMFDVFHLPVLDLRVGGSSNPRLNAYSTGLLATLLATPCSGPLLGGVLGWSLMQSMPVLLTVFLATGLGMALPYLAMAWKPSLANLLPRPGAWMLTFERILGFFLMGTGIYLLSILPSSMQLPALVVLLAVAMAAWAWGRWGSLRGTALRRLAVGGACLAGVGVTLYICFAPTEKAVPWQPFQPATFQAELGKKPLLVEFTADWCPTCKVLERTTLTPDRLNPLARRYGLTLIRVDLTRHDPEAQALLRALDSASIPLLAVFPAGNKAREPVVLRDLYTAGQMRRAIEQALAPHEPMAR